MGVVPCYSRNSSTRYRCILMTPAAPLAHPQTGPRVSIVLFGKVYHGHLLGHMACMPSTVQSFYKAARDLGYRWAWSDTCCIDKSIDAEQQKSIKSMFDWYHHSALTVVYLSDVPALSKPGA
ncbi:uncharacterized protein HD556DRAFT_1352001 [Suillus plorans]|uniref:Heterokaryon incompatibility domain-containing protein n=1 Tax=Suillus plorans TaxID=116603 RepID=A0A9P7DMS7_9AGAM|nr:uncharacterized protein HD556DRAFT_1352001 [Suillus plorans]KAG1798624.1 hypothetical protein HD556DRAFT_1352001 [Suillus plorans]